MTQQECGLHAERLRKEQRKEQPLYKGIVIWNARGVLVFYEGAPNFGTRNLDRDGLEITEEQGRTLRAAGAKYLSEQELNPLRRY